MILYVEKYTSLNKDEVRRLNRMTNVRCACQEPASLYAASNQSGMNDFSSVDGVFGNFITLFVNTKKTGQNEVCVRFNSLISEWFAE